MIMLLIFIIIVITIITTTTTIITIIFIKETAQDQKSRTRYDQSAIGMRHVGYPKLPGHVSPVTMQADAHHPYLRPPTSRHYTGWGRLLFKCLYCLPVCLFVFHYRFHFLCFSLFLGGDARSVCRCAVLVIFFFFLYIF